MEHGNYDVIIIGGGFTGVTAARELNQKGYKTVILEARDRLGGRTWFDHRMGRNLEMGGTWVHWFQPHVWAEITRYQLDVVPSPVPDKAYWISNNEAHTGTIDELFGSVDKGMNELLADSQKYFPLPYKPLQADNLKEMDHLTVTDMLKRLDLTADEYDIMHSIWALNFNGSPEEGGISQTYRWAALSNYNWVLMMDICASFKLAKGTKELLERIASDADTDIFLSKVVSSIAKTGENYTVTTKDGEHFKGKTVINTLPLNILNSIDYQPALSIKKQQAGAEGQTSKGVKFWAKVKGLTEPMLLFQPADYPINYAQYEYADGDDGIIVGFGPDATKLDPENRVEVEEALRHCLPDIEVIESTGHDWVADEFAGETWPMQRNNQLSDYLAELQRPEDGLFIAGADYANGWAGFIDGAIESAFSTTRKVYAYLRKLSQNETTV
ncbi:flavin monoamine oxidase family protein [Aquibacillus sediminis]|uniref:flavin monoamine oxidase family protein n=1 Tax=Aquibacillus sediminis TaxID=2574734 RepID=UPI0011091AF6|nr:NAD(P)/FAD-dependent oxidoreductase [Aquibacillus sediminis]